MKKIYRSVLGIILLMQVVYPSQAQEKSLSLREAQVQAIKFNKGLQIQRLEEEKAGELVKEAKSHLLPSISINGSYSYFFDRQVIFVPGSFVETPEQPVVGFAVGGRHAFNSFLSVSQPLLMNGARKRTKTVMTSEKIEQEKTDDTESELLHEVSVHYLSTLLLQEQLVLQQQSFQRNLRALADSRSLFAQGRSFKVDTLRNYIAAENLRSSVAFLKTQINIAKSNLKRIIGFDQREDLVLSDSLYVEEVWANLEKDIGKVLDLALENRSDIKIQKLNILKSQKEISEIKSERLPQIWLTGQYQLQAQADDFKLSQYSWPATSFVGAQVMVPIFSGNRINSREHQAQITLQQNEIGLSDMQEKMENELVTIVSKLEEAQERLAIQKNTVDAAGLSYSMVEDRYQQGVGSRLELSDAELALTQAKTNYLQAVYQVKVLRLELQKALGLLKSQIN